METKIKLKIEDTDSFFRRAQNLARRADQGKFIKTGIAYSFEEIEALESFISSRDGLEERSAVAERRPKPRQVRG